MGSTTKAIIPVAGYGTRRLPITKTIEKCMLPIGNRPIVDYVVQDCIAAGITNIYFVVGENSTQIRDYYGRNEALERYLRDQGKEDKLALIAPPAGVNFTFITQPQDGNYGTAVPVALARDYVEEDESVVVVMGDDFIYNADGSSEVARLLEQTTEAGLLAAKVELKSGGTYGLIAHDSQGYYQRIVDQPTVADNPPSNLINISKYLLNRRILDIAAALKPAYNGEYQLPEAINQYAREGGRVKVVTALGEYLDGGSLDGWLHANQVVAGRNFQ